MNLVGLIFFPLTKRYYYKFCLSWVMVCGFLGLPLLLVANSMDIQISQALFVSWAFIIGFIFSIFFPELKENTLEIKLDGMIAAKLVVMAIVTYLVVQNPESVT